MTSAASNQRWCYNGGDVHSTGNASAADRPIVAATVAWPTDIQTMGPRTGIYLPTKFGSDRSIVVGCRSWNDRQTSRQTSWNDNKAHSLQCAVNETQLFSHRMTSILSGNVKFTGCQIYLLSQYHRNAQYIMAKRMHVLKTHTLHNRAWQQMNQIIKTTVQCIHHSLESQHSVCHATDQQVRYVNYLLVKILPAGVHSVLEIIQIENWNMTQAIILGADGWLDREYFLIREPDNINIQQRSS